MPQERPTDPLLRIASYLDELGLEYAVTGSVAGIFYGLMRQTYDIDITVELPNQSVPRVVAALQQDYFIDEVSVLDAVRSGSMFNVLPHGGGDKVDLIVLTDTEFERTKLARRQQVEWKGGLVWVLTAEDLVLSKLDWARDSGSRHQYPDVRAIMDSGSAADHEYLDEWIRRLDLQHVLDAANSARHDT